MSVLVICTPAASAERASFSALLEKQRAGLRDLKREGVLVHAWSPGRPGMLLLLDCDEGMARGIVSRLPLNEAGLVTTELTPLQELDL